MGPCLVCHEEHASAGINGLLIPRAEEGAFVEAGCGAPTVEASAADIEAVATVASQSIINLLRERIGTDNHCFLVNEPVLDAAETLSRVGTFWSEWPPIANCESCGDNSESRRIYDRSSG